jgi:hypothetical protein
MEMAVAANGRARAPRSLARRVVAMEAEARNFEGVWFLG